jgi:hypothetical protein
LRKRRRPGARHLVVVRLGRLTVDLRDTHNQAKAKAVALR